MGRAWIGVPALVLVLLGVLVLVDVMSRQQLSHELLDSGIETVADQVQVEVPVARAVRPSAKCGSTSPPAGWTEFVRLSTTSKTIGRE